MDQRGKRPDWVFWTAAFVGSAILYVASVGPALWFERRGWLPDGGVAHSAATSFYAPLAWLREGGPKPIRDALDWYGDLWWGD